MTTLLVGFDSAWTADNLGAFVGVVRSGDGTMRELGPPQTVDFLKAGSAIVKWQDEHAPSVTIVLLDQPTIVPNPTGQRPVENIVGSVVSLRYGGMQPASKSRSKMFGASAPVWPFLEWFGGAASSADAVANTLVFETYPVLAMIALGWTLPDPSPRPRPTGRLPKYNPDRRKTFSISDWQHVCGRASESFRKYGLMQIVSWIEDVAQKSPVLKPDQDKLDACICLLVAVSLAERKLNLMVGDSLTGYIVVPHSAPLRREIVARCRATGRAPLEWMRVFRQGAL
jgi:predicted RNase H-like nuclease